MLQEGERPGTADDESPHVGDVEDPGPFPRREMFFHNSGSVLERHMPAAEIDHRRAEGDMLVVQNCLIYQSVNKILKCCCLHEKYMIIFP